jgi:hypothetical protein
MQKTPWKSNSPRGFPTAGESESKIFFIFLKNSLNAIQGSGLRLETGS